MARALASYIDTFYFSEFQKKKGGLCSRQPTPKSALASASADVNNYCYSGFVNVMENLESHGILTFHFPRLESHGILYIKSFLID